MPFRRVGILAALALMATLSACNRDLSPLNTVTSSSGPVVAPPAGCPAPFDPSVFCDFEVQPTFTGSPLFWWSGGGSPVHTLSWTQFEHHSCFSAGKFASGAYYLWGNMFGVQITPRDFSAGSPTKFSMWYKIDASLSSSIYIDEGSSHGGGDGEEWRGTINLVAGTWTQLTVPLGTLLPDGTHNGVLALNDIQHIWFWYNAPYPAHTLYFDDFQFIN